MNYFYLVALLSIAISTYGVKDSSIDLLSEHKELVTSHPTTKAAGPTIIEDIT